MTYRFRIKRGARADARQAPLLPAIGMNHALIDRIVVPMRGIRLFGCRGAFGGRAVIHGVLWRAGRTGLLEFMWRVGPAARVNAVSVNR